MDEIKKLQVFIGDRPYALHVVGREETVTSRYKYPVAEIRNVSMVTDNNLVMAYEVFLKVGNEHKLYKRYEGLHVEITYDVK